MQDEERQVEGFPDNRPFKVHYVTSTRDNAETSLRMMITRAYELLDKRTEECVQKHGNANAAKSDLYVFGFRGSYLYRWEKNAWRARSDAAAVWSKDVESLVSLSQKKDETPGATGPGMPISYAPKYTDDDGDLRDTAANPKGASTQESRGGMHNYVNTPYPEHPGEAPDLKPAEVRRRQEQSSYLSSRGLRTSARPAEHRSNRRFIVQHVLAREAGEPFIYAVIRNKAITRERVTAEEWKKASETAHIVFPNRDSEWNAVLERAVHNDFMYAALDASRAAGRIDQEYINPRDRKSAPWADQQWNMKKLATEAANIPLGMRQDIQAKYHHERAPPGDWADMPDRDDYMVRGVVSDPNRRAYDCLRAPGVRATLLNAQTGQCIPFWMIRPGCRRWHPRICWWGRSPRSHRTWTVPLGAHGVCLCSILS